MPGVTCCWTSMAPWPLMDALNQAIAGPGTDFELTTRWGSVATPGGTSGQGDPITLTYSFVPDGTNIPSGAGEPGGPSDMFAKFNTVFTSQSVWQNAIHQSFQRWGELTGITYVHEPNDDGAGFFSSPGVLGVRGDIRVGGKHIDGTSGSNILAFNSLPSGGGDMTLDTDNLSFFSNASNNFRRLRNTVMHENGHGIGMVHVCPANGSKLMEPTINTSFDGPREDDVRGGQRHYGDAFEHNDSASQATDRGTLGNGLHFIQNVSIDDNSDSDWFKFSVTGNKSLSVTMSPFGTTYTAGPQNATCTSTNTIAAGSVHDIGFEIRDVNANTVLAAVNQNPAGQAESSFAVALPSGPGTYYVRAFGSSADDVQRYTMQWSISDTVQPPFTFIYPNGIPATITPGFPADVDVLVTPGTGTPDPSTATLFISTGGGFTSSALQDLGGGVFRATLPASPCFTQLAWYVSIAPLQGGAAIVSPAGAPTFARHETEALFTPLTEVFSDDFQTNTGWTVSNSALLTDGPWERGIPIGGGVRGDPPTDSDGSGQCFLTDNAPGNSDVDGGSTILTSPAFDLSGETDAVIEVDVWFDNDFGNNPGTDPFLIQVSNNGTGWIQLETYNASPDVWVTKRYRLSQFPIALTSTMQVRFIAQDPDPGAVVEAGIDAFKVLVCTPQVALDPSCGVGTVGITTPLGPEDVFKINLQTGGAARRVDLSIGAAIILQMLEPGLSPGPGQVPFIIFGRLGVPTAAEITPLPFGIGTMCFSPTILDPTDPNLFVVADNLINGGAVLPSVPAPWTQVLPGAPFPIQITMQPVILEDGVNARTANGIILNVQ